MLSRQRKSPAPLAIAAGVTLVLLTTLAVAGAPAGSRTACFSLHGSAGAAEKDAAVAAIRKALLAGGRVPIGGGAPLEDSALVLGCSIGEAACRARVAASFDVDELLYGTLDSRKAAPGAGAVLTLTLVNRTGKVIAHDAADVALPLREDEVKRLVDGLRTGASAGSKKGPVTAAPLLPATAAGATSAPEPPKAPRAPLGPHKLLAPGGVTLAAGAAFLGAGAAFGLWTRGLNGRIEAGLADLGSPVTEDDVMALSELSRLGRRADTAAAMANISFTAGIAAAAIGAVLVLLDLAGVGRGSAAGSPESEPGAAGAAGAPRVTLRPGGVAVTW